MFHNTIICGELLIQVVEDTGLPNFLTGFGGCTIKFGTSLNLVRLFYDESYSRMKKVTSAVCSCRETQRLNGTN